MQTNLNNSVSEPCLTVGVTGHIDLAQDAMADIQERTAGLLRELKTILQSLVRQRQELSRRGTNRPLLRVVSALAKGADQCVAKAALGAGCDLQCILPFPVDIYLKTFPNNDHEVPTVRDTLRVLMGKASLVTELGGRFCDGEGNPDKKAQYQAFEDVGRAIIGQSDLMLAIWNGVENNRPGGTAAVVGAALESGLSVLWVLDHDKCQARILRLRDTGEREDLPMTSLSDILAGVLNRK